MGSRVPNPEGLPEIRDEPDADCVEPKRDVTPLMEFLMHVPMEELCTFIERLHMDCTLRLEAAGKHAQAHGQLNIARAVLRPRGGLEYQGSGKNLRAALTNAVAKYFTGEQRDFHLVREAARRR